MRCTLLALGTAMGAVTILAVLWETASARPNGTFIWQRSGPKRPDVVLPPWTPLVVKDDSAETLGRSYQFDALGLPRRMVSRSTDLLAEPSYLLLNGKRVVPRAAKPTWKRRGEANATLAGQAQVGNLRIETRGKLEFDGLVRTKLTVSSTERTRIRDLTLVIPLRKTIARYLDFSVDVGDRGARLWHPGLLRRFLIDGRWRNAFLPVLWLGDENVGMAWCAESTEGWQTDGNATEIEIVDTGKAIELRVHFVQGGVKALEVIDPFTIEFGWMATPAKPRPKGWRNWHFVNETNEQRRRKAGNITILWHSTYSEALGSPRPRDPALMTRLVTEAHRDGYKVIPYIALTETMADIASEGAYSRKMIGGKSLPVPPEVTALGDDWHHSPCGIGWSTSRSANKHWGVRACPRSSWTDFLLYYIKENIRKYDIDGIYFDNTALIRCDKASHGCGYVDRNGKRRTTTTVFVQREFYKNVYRAFVEAGKEPIIMLHSSCDMVVPAYSFVQATFDGEQFNGHWRGPQNFEHLVPLDMFRAHYHGRQFGMVPVFLPSPGFRSKDQCEEHLVYTLLHDMQLQKGWLDPGPLEKVWAVRGGFGAAGKGPVKFTGYWENTAIVPSPDRVKVSYWTAGNKVLAVAANVERADADATITIDRKQLGGITNLVDALTRKPIAHRNGVLKFSLPGKRFRLFQFDRTPPSKPYIGPGYDIARLDASVLRRHHTDSLGKAACRDASGQGNDIRKSEYCKLVKGKRGRGVSFMPGNGAYLCVLNSDSISLSDALTIEAWVWMDPKGWTNDYGRILSKDQSTDPVRNPLGLTGYTLSVGPMGDVQFLITLNGHQVRLNGGAPRNKAEQTEWTKKGKKWVRKGKWVHVAATYDGARMIIYIDGVETARRNASGRIFQTIGHLYIGNSMFAAGPRYQLHGDLDEVYLWSTARTAKQIQQDMARTPKPDTTGLVGCWRFETR